MSKRSPYGLAKGDRRRIDRHLDHLDQRPISGSDEATIAGAVCLATGLHDASSIAALTIGLVPITIAVVVGGASTNMSIAMLLLGLLIGAALMGSVVIAIKAQASTAEAARAVVEHRVSAARSLHTASAEISNQSGRFQRVRRRRRVARATRPEALR
ncbi:hypothetical protein [Brachybacterium sp. UNK5269]|uniref:hypothetical protein n=1 Tax=Brachybacterium sp. UNK5269 TaxID=3408576 RepID=UPI003BB0A4EB